MEDFGGWARKVLNAASRAYTSYSGGNLRDKNGQRHMGSAGPVREQALHQEVGWAIPVIF